MNGKTKPFNLADFELLDTAPLTIQNPRGDDLLVDGEKVVIHVFGQGSKQYVNAKHKFDTKIQTRNVALLRGAKANKNEAEENSQLTAELLAACTASIDNFPVEGGALAIYSNPKLKYITDQVDKFIGDTENFMPT